MNIHTTTTMIVALIAMIGMTGFAMAGSTTDVYVGSGSYNTEFDGYDGDITIRTYTPEGSDVLHCGADGYFEGEQYMDSDPGWTEIERYTETGYNGATMTQTVDNSGDMIGTVAAGNDYAGTYQYVGIADNQSESGYTGDAVVAMTGVYAGGDDAYVEVMTTAGDTMTLVAIGCEGDAYIESLAGAATDEDVGSASGQLFYAEAGWYYGADGEANIVTTGSDEIGFDVSVWNDNMHYDTSGTLYGNDTNPAFMNLHDDFDYGYEASGYVYAIDLN